ncbi:MAG: OmpH family outer membrane protein [Sphingorhabdus sp.]|nr:OmpH family outer membrane protein [Sphingorhabdus sp.]
MKISLKSMVASSVIAAAIFVSGSASAQVGGIATADPTIAIARAKALGAGYQQIQTTYDSYIKQIDVKSGEQAALQKLLDTNKDNNLTEDEVKAAETSKNPNFALLVAKQNEINVLRQPIVIAQHFVIQNISDQYPAAQDKVVAAKKVSVIVTPEALVWAPAAADVTNLITDEIDKVIPVVATTPPANWQPTRQTAAIHQQIQQLLVASARQQAAQAAAKPAGAAAPQPQGR